ncbi:monosaccharide ABC transporter substrate-binding protein (CUT2 family) [Microcella alkaliphila]|uniref:Monosaccharide ABC transporter substrate-binding protein (CUT2 family) n=1 Tax=Microcella alkaliphila TaxID=279828 RepID=A0A4Q7TZ93_9MICO|nr:substrate-binding domain-containing protein [Microcella alkaliphila]RZT66464.1 monosaccharide ABC transporter substrate-binding protein (CUT2 family) [Microcella alkaliphila]
MANATDPYWISVMCGADAAAKEAGVELKWYTTPTTSTDTMSQAFNAATLTEPDGLILNPFQATQFSTQVGELMQDGIPVVTSTPLDPATQYTDVPLATDGSNFVDEFMKILPEGPGSIVALGGITGIPVLDATWKPLEEAAAEQRPDITVLPTEYTDFDVTKTTQIVNGLLLAHPDLSVIIASTGPEGQGAAAAVQQAGKAGDVKIWAYDAVPAEVEALKDGVITVLAAKPAQAAGEKYVAVLLEAINDNPDKEAVSPLSPALDPLPLTIITQDNVDSPEAQAAMYKETCDA